MIADDAAAGTPLESPLPPAILRGLGDRSYDKRKIAALEITSLIKSLQENGEKERIGNAIILLSHEFCRSRNANHRKGGLIGLAAAAIGLMVDIDVYLHLLVPPVLECFDDQESRVCYYACESMYNISKVARTGILKYFNQIFDGLCKLFAHVDVDVKNGANLLDRIVKDIVTETEIFDIESFIPLLQKHIKKTKPYIRQLLVGWITVLDAVPDIAMLDFLPEFLEGLFNMLSDGNGEIRKSADNCLSEFMREIKEAAVVEFGPMVNILVQQCHSKDRFTRLKAINWVHEFIVLGGARLRLFYSDLLNSVMHCISDVDVDIRSASKDTNDSFMTLVRSTAEQFELKMLLNSLTVELLSDHIITRVTSLEWINMLHEKDAAGMNNTISDLLPVLLKTLSDTSDDVLLINLQVLARIALDEVQFMRVLQALVQLFMEDRRLLETRGALIIRKLSALLDGRNVFMSLASILRDKSDLEFVSLMIQTLNLIVLTAPELTPLRKSLKDCFQGGDNEAADKHVFMSLFQCWCHNPVATFSLCLLAQAYDLSACLIFKFADVDVSVGFLMQVDKLIQLLESPIFIHLRLHLLETSTRHHADLLKSLYGLLMLLPQSLAYKTLSDRLATVSSLQMHLGLTQTREGGGSKVIEDVKESKKKGFLGDKKSPEKASGNNSQSVDFTELLQRFDTVQHRHATFRLSLLQQKSLLFPQEETSPLMNYNPNLDK